MTERDELRAAIEGVLRSSTEPSRWSRLVDLGLVGLGTPEDDGGSGGSMLDLGAAVEACAVRVTPVPLFSAALAVRALAQADPIDSELVRACCSGARRATVMLAGPDETTGIRAEDSCGQWKLTGAAKRVPDAIGATMLLVSAYTSHGPALFAIEVRAPAVSVDAVPSLDTTRPLADVELDAAPARLLVEPTQWSEESLRVDAAVLLAADSTGGARGALDAAVSYAKTRRQFGRPIGSFQAVKHRLADMSLAVASSSTVTTHALSLLADRDPEAALYASMAKVVAGDNYLQVATAAIQTFGGIGFTWEHSAHLHLKRAQANRMLYGTSDDHVLTVADRAGL